MQATLGTALGALVVTFLLDASWPVRIGLVALVLAVGLVLLARHGRATATGSADPADPRLPSGPVDSGGQVDDRPSPAAYGTSSTDMQGDTTDD